jgi:sec-independent protein translocase protein TatA
MPVVVAEIVGWEFLLVLAVVALLFGSTQIPKFARSLGQASKEFRKGVEDDHDHADDHADGDTAKGGDA